MIECAAAGIPPHLFYDYTYREIYAVLAGAQLSARRSHKLTLWGHWHGQNMRRAKKLPPLRSLLRGLEPARAMTAQAIRSTILSLAESMGANVVRKKRKKD